MPRSSYEYLSKQILSAVTISYPNNFDYGKLQLKHTTNHLYKEETEYSEYNKDENTIMLLDVMDVNMLFKIKVTAILMFMNLAFERRMNY